MKITTMLVDFFSLPDALVFFVARDLVVFANGCKVVSVVGRLVVLSLFCDQKVVVLD